MSIILKLFFLFGLAAAQVDVIPLVEEWQQDEMVNSFTLVTWSTLIRDGENTIVVDVPPSTETGAEKKLIDALKERNLTPDGIQMVVLTHDRPTNLGDDRLFPKANQFFSTYEHNGKTYLQTGLFESGKIQLTRHVQLWSTPGFTAEDITVMVSNVEGRGIVAIAGNLIYNENDIMDSQLWESKAQHPQAGMKRRRKVICHADYIIPGHGPIFQVTDKHRDVAGCNEHGQGTNEGESDAIAELRRRRRQREQERLIREMEERQRTERQRRDNEYQHNLGLWRQDREVDRPVQADANCCQQQPCQANQPMCGGSYSSGCCSQPPCQNQQPPCYFASSCCQQSQSCQWNQLRCRSSCQVEQPSYTQCGQNEIHHHYIAPETEIFHDRVRKEQTDLTKLVNDQQKLIREEQDKVNQMFLEHLNDFNSDIQRHFGELRRQQSEFNQILSRQKQEMEEIQRRHSEEIQNHLTQPPTLPLNTFENLQKKYDEHKQRTDTFWSHQEHVQATRKAQDEATYRKIVKPGRNYTTTVTRESCNYTAAAPRSCDVQCSQGCNSGCATGCATQGCATGCGGGGCGGCGQGCGSSCCNGCGTDCLPPAHRHAPGQRHYGGRRRRLRRHEAHEKREPEKLQQAQDEERQEE